MCEMIAENLNVNRSQVLHKLCSLIPVTPDGDDSVVVNEHTLIASLALDSLKLIEIIFELELHFNIAVDEGAMVEACSLGDVVSLFCEVGKECGKDV